MWEAYWRFFVWWSVFVVWYGSCGIQVVESVDVVQCMAMDDTQLPSVYTTLPSNITFYPLSDEWQLNFTIQETEKSEPLVYITLESKPPNFKLSLFNKSYADHHPQDSHSVNLGDVKLHHWTLLYINNHNNRFTIDLNTDDTTLPSLQLKSITLPTNGLLQIIHTRSILSAIGCHKNCAKRFFSSPNLNNFMSTGIQSNATEFIENNAYFFFSPGKDFRSLNFKVSCNTTNNTIVSVENELSLSYMKAITTNLDEWPEIVLDFNQQIQQFSISINKVLALRSPVPNYCPTFNKMVVMTRGESYMYLNCDPTIKEKHDNTYWTPWRIGMYIIAGVVILAILIACCCCKCNVKMNGYIRILG